MSNHELSVLRPSMTHSAAATLCDGKFKAVHRILPQMPKLSGKRLSEPHEK